MLFSFTKIHSCFHILPSFDRLPSVCKGVIDIARCAGVKEYARAAREMSHHRDAGSAVAMFARYGTATDTADAALLPCLRDAISFYQTD